ncbi:MAG: MarR family winged helix-turn-helix transcriptional regulator [Terriglobia bacterium]
MSKSNPATKSAPAAGRAATSGVHTWLVLWKAFESVRRHAHRDIESLGIGLTDFGVLEMLLHKGPLPVNVIGARVLLTSGSMTVAIDRLEKKGLVERRAHATDRRARVVHLTPAGRKLVEPAFRAHQEAMEIAAAGVSRAQREKLIALLKKLGKSAERSFTETASG